MALRRDGTMEEECHTLHIAETFAAEDCDTEDYAELEVKFQFN